MSPQASGLLVHYLYPWSFAQSKNLLETAPFPAAQGASRNHWLEGCEVKPRWELGSASKTA